MSDSTKLSRSSSLRPLVIDAQLFQTTAWNRGMGHYCKSLLGAYVRAYGSQHITLLLNKNLLWAEERSEVLRQLLPDATVVQLDLPTLTGDIPAGQAAAAKTLRAYITEAFSATKVDFLLLQLFTFDYCAAFPGTPPAGMHKLVLCFDLIPLLYWSEFSRYFAPHMYFPHFTTLLEADTLLAISETAKHQLEDSFAIDSERIVNIDGAYIARQIPSDHQATFAMPEKPFILFPTADLPHKNNVVAVDAFRRFNQELADKFTLVITSTISEHTQKQLRCYTDRIVFTGNISDAELEALFTEAHAVLLVSSVEGLGLPILEAVQHQKPTICSAIDVFKEISEEAFYYCDPNDVGSVARAIRQAVIGSGWEVKRAQYEGIKKKYTWERSAEGLEKALGQQQDSGPTVKGDVGGAGRKFAVVYPHPSTSSGSLGQYVQSLLPALQRHGQVVSYVSSDPYVDEARKPYFAPFLFPVSNAMEFIVQKERTSHSGQPIYFIDDTTASVDVLRAALVYPGLCYVTAKRAGKLLRAMASQGYISSDVAEALPTSLRQNALPDLLQQVGNEVRMLDISPQVTASSSSKTTKAGGAKLKSGGKLDSRYQVVQDIVGRRGV